jgi:hypothetical protein
MTPADLLLELKARVEAATQRAVAYELDVSPQYLHDVLKGRREPGKAILEPMGLVKVVRYEKAPRCKR